MPPAGDIGAALGLKGDLDAAKTAVAELLKVKPEVNSLARFRAYRPWGNPQYWALYDEDRGCRLAPSGFPRRVIATCRIAAILAVQDPCRGQDPRRRGGRQGRRDRPSGARRDRLHP